MPEPDLAASDREFLTYLLLRVVAHVMLSLPALLAGWMLLREMGLSIMVLATWVGWLAPFVGAVARRVRRRIDAEGER